MREEARIQTERHASPWRGNLCSADPVLLRVYAESFAAIAGDFACQCLPTRHGAEAPPQHRGLLLGWKSLLRSLSVPDASSKSGVTPRQVEMSGTRRGSGILGDLPQVCGLAAQAGQLSARRIRRCCLLACRPRWQKFKLASPAQQEFNAGRPSTCDLPGLKSSMRQVCDCRSPSASSCERVSRSQRVTLGPLLCKLKFRLAKVLSVVRTTAGQSSCWPAAETTSAQSRSKSRKPPARAAPPRDASAQEQR